MIKRQNEQKKPKGDAERAIKREIKCLYGFAELASAVAGRTEIVTKCHRNSTAGLHCGKYVCALQLINPFSGVLPIKAYKSFIKKSAVILVNANAQKRI